MQRMQAAFPQLRGCCSLEKVVALMGRKDRTKETNGSASPGLQKPSA
jgi:hypothetical protein